MLRETIIGAAIGVVIGVPAAAWLAGALTPYLFGIRVYDPAAYLLAIGLLSLATLVATIPPARRASRVDPMAVLRAD